VYSEAELLEKIN